MPECHYCGKEAGKYVQKSKGSRKYCSTQCSTKAQYKGENVGVATGFLLNVSPYQDGQEKQDRKRLFLLAKEGDETAALELRLRYNIRVIQ